MLLDLEMTHKLKVYLFFLTFETLLLLVLSFTFFFFKREFVLLVFSFV